MEPSESLLTYNEAGLYSLAYNQGYQNRIVVLNVN